MLNSFRSKGALAAALMAAAMFAPAMPSPSSRVVTNQAGERLLPRPKPKPKPKPRLDDAEKIASAARRRERRQAKRLADAAAGGWISSQRCHWGRL